MGTYDLPRNVKGEGKILFIFSKKAMVYTAIGVGIGVIFYLILSLFKMDIVGIIIVAVLGLIGFIIGTFKIPRTNSFEFTKNTGGEDIDDVIKRAIKFKLKKKRIYVNKINNFDKTDKKEENKRWVIIWFQIF